MRIKTALTGALTATALLLTGAATAGAATTSAGTASASTAAADITRAKAIKIAKKAVPGARVTDVEREYEHGHRTWKIELEKGRYEYDVYVSIKTGKIIKFKVDRD
ncbi:hypothetical protein Aph01nite_03430 [Acrocarpospora phusangensis]|uniref:PepSY domain-containing protein n=1 Tax=Acrocarpospora phusangensis TaxID=1070424 RepID=A0A919Q6U4_9ACTN|nr:PepSY domain-containing protein [Acrocarpospora phusangensis]GIH22033.1 hypothetical protein Aph01nite_03430 [Acrocarpospora phusangensis]